MTPGLSGSTDVLVVQRHLKLYGLLRTTKTAAQLLVLPSCEREELCGSMSIAQDQPPPCWTCSAEVNAESAKG